MGKPGKYYGGRGGRGSLSGANLISVNADFRPGGRQVESFSQNPPPPPPPVYFEPAQAAQPEIQLPLPPPIPPPPPPIIMAPATRPTAPPTPTPEVAPVTGPHPSYIQVAKPYVFQQQLQGQLVAIGANPTREDTFRLQGVQWINDVRIQLQLPVRTFCTACVYYHKFRLVHKDDQYQFHDAAAAALLTACKIEDTLKKSKEILCAAHNVKVGHSEHLSPDDNAFEVPSKIVIGLERLMLEASGFDFRVRFPHKHLIKLAKASQVDADVAKTAYRMMIDLYRTFAPLKHSCAAMAFACVELATVLLNKQQDFIRDQKPRRWHTSRAQVMEAILDLVEHYTHFQKSSIVGPFYPIDTFIDIRIKMNQELEAESLTRYTEQHDSPKTNGIRTNIKTPKTPITPASPSDLRTNGNKDIASPATLSPRSSGSGRRGIGARGQEGTVRFMLDGEKAKREKDTVAEYYKVEYEEYEVEVEEPIKQERNDYNHNNHHNHNHRGGGQHMRNGRDGGYHHNKRVRR